MHLNAAPDKLEALAPFAVGPGLRSSGRSRIIGMVRKRNEAIAEALRGGHDARTIGDIVGLTVRSVEEIANKVVLKPREAPERFATPLRVSTVFDQASPMALAVLNAKPGTCRWPFGDRENFRFCGAVAVTGAKPEARTYCQTCAVLAYPGRARALVTTLTAEAA